MAEAAISLWTAAVDYFATGEGRTMMALICLSPDEAGARKQFGIAFDPFFAQGCTVERGVARNQITQFLWSSEALDYFEQLKSGGIEAKSTFHFNLS